MTTSTGPEVPRLHRVLDEVRYLIVTGSYAPGEKLRAERIAQELGVSPTPVREAFQRLAAEGLVAYSSQRGVRVTPATRQELEELYELRYRLEPEAIARSIPRMSAASESDVRSRLADLDRWYRTEKTLQGVGYERAHTAFHRSLYAGCDSGWLSEIVGTLALASMRYRGMGDTAPSPAAARAEHAGLAEAVLAGDTEQARRLCVAHLESAHLPARAAFEAQPA